MKPHVSKSDKKHEVHLALLSGWLLETHKTFRLRRFGEMATIFDEESDLTTCCVCINEFNDDGHKPKYLACHHTICKFCLEVGGIYSFLIKLYSVLLIFT